MIGPIRGIRTAALFDSMIPWIFILVIVGPHAHCEAHLLEIVDAGDPFSLGFALGEGGEQHACENRDDRDYHQQFNQRKAVPGTVILLN